MRVRESDVEARKTDEDEWVTEVIIAWRYMELSSGVTGIWHSPSVGLYEVRAADVSELAF